MFCQLVCARQQILLYARIARMLAYHKMAHEANDISLFKYGDRTLNDWFGGSLEEETQLVDLFAEFASGKEDIRVFCGIEFVSLSTGKILSSPFVEDSTLQYSAFDNFVSGYTLI